MEYIRGNGCKFSSGQEAVFFLRLGSFSVPSGISEACMGVLGIQDICHFTSRDIGYFPFYFQGYGILCLIFGLLCRILNILEN